MGLALLVAGGEILVRGATLLARLAGLPPAVIGLTVVAAGTSLPELTVSLLAAWRGETDIAVANMIGSNIFNLLGILGISAMVHPIHFAESFGTTDLWWMIGTAVLLLPVLWTGRIISRIEGLALALVYVAYTALLLRG